MVSLLAALPYSIHTRTYNAVVLADSNLTVPESLICSIPYSYLNGFMYYMFQVSTFFFFLGPITIIVILYILIGLALHRSTFTRSAPDKETKDAKSKKLPSSQQPRRVVIRMLGKCQPLQHLHSTIIFVIVS